MFIRRLIQEGSSYLSKCFCKGSHGSGYSSKILYVLLQIYFKDRSILVFQHP